jgi:hypothetical protein
MAYLIGHTTSRYVPRGILSAKYRSPALYSIDTHAWVKIRTELLQKFIFGLSWLTNTECPQLKY